MKKVIIIGAGFAGLNAGRRLSRSGLDLEITLFDKKNYFDFLPLIPDILGRGIQPQLLRGSTSEFVRKSKINFIQKEVTSVDLSSRQVTTAAGSYNYDFLIIASGSQVNYFGNLAAEKYAYALNSIEDAQRILAALEHDRFENFIICGGGYTGVEGATNLWRYFKKKGQPKKIIIVERSSDILGPLPEKMKLCVRNNLKRMGIDIMANTVVEDIGKDEIKVSGGVIFKKAMLIWVPGVRAADFIQKLSVEKNPQGRITVDAYLKFKEDCFCSGDTAFFKGKSGFLRMAVQFSIMEGLCAADNIIRSIKKKPLKKFHPMDLGYVIPMANNYSYGKALGLDVCGRLATFLHYAMCIYRSYSWKNKLGLIGTLLRPLSSKRW